MQFLKQSTAAILKLGPFVDSTDGVTAETGLTIAQADIQISKNGAAFAQTSEASPTTTHDADGWYPIPLTATDTGTLGTLTVQVTMAGALPVWIHCLVVTANVYDTLCSTDMLQADLTQIGGVAQSATDLKDFADTGYDPSTHKAQSDLIYIHGTALTETDGQLAGAFKKFFDVGTPTGTVNSIPDAVAGAAGGLFIAGTNAETTITTALNANLIGDITGGITGNITGSMSGSVGSVTGAVGSVTGAVGSVSAGVSLANGAITSEKFDQTTAYPANLAIVNYNLDHLCKTATAGADMTSEVVDNSILSRILANGDTSAFVPSTDGLQLIRDALLTAAEVLATPANKLATDESGQVKLSPDGLDSIPTTAPTGVASTFREMIVQIWRRLFKKSTMTASELKTYADNGTDVLTTQSVSDDGTTQTQGASS